MQKFKQISTDVFSDITYRKVGSGKALVLLHGFPDDGGLWDEIVSPLSENYTVIAPDLPCSTPDLTVELMADSVKGILDTEGIVRAIIVGHSMGGYVALAFAEKYANIVEGLAMIHSTPNADDEEKIEVRKKAISIIRKGGKEVFIRQMIPNLFSEKTMDNNPELIRKQTERGNELEADCLIAFYNAMIKRKNRSEVLKNGVFPVMWVVGKDDVVVPFATVKQHCIAANVNFVYMYPNCGHMSMLETPQKLIKDIKTFSSYCFGKFD